MPSTAILHTQSSIYAQNRAPRGAVTARWARHPLEVEVPRIDRRELQGEVPGGPALIAWNGRWYSLASPTLGGFNSRFGDVDNKKDLFFSPFHEPERGRIYMQARSKPGIDPSLLQGAEDRIRDMTKRRFLVMGDEVYFSRGTLGWHVGVRAGTWCVRRCWVTPRAPDLRTSDESNNMTSGMLVDGRLGTFFDVNQLADAYEAAQTFAAAAGQQFEPIVDADAQAERFGSMPFLVDEIAVTAQIYADELRKLVGQVEMISLDDRSAHAWIAFLEADEAGQPEGIFATGAQFAASLRDAVGRIPGIGELIERAGRASSVIALRRELDAAVKLQPRGVL
jgi:hypothetical protein